MVRREVRDCDGCKKKDVPCASFVLATTSTYDGVERSSVNQHYDICITCVQNVMHSFNRSATYEEVGMFVEKSGLEACRQP